VELDTYGLLPRGMSVRQAQDIVTFSSRRVSLPVVLRGERRFYNSSLNENENLLCLVAGHTNHTWFENPVARLLEKTLSKLLSIFINIIWLWILAASTFMLYVLVEVWYTICELNPFNLLNRIYIGCEEPSINKKYPSSGWVDTIGVFGIQKHQGTMTGALPIEPNPWPVWNPNLPWVLGYPAVVGFSGLKIGRAMSSRGSEYDYLGSAVWVRISSDL